MDRDPIPGTNNNGAKWDNMGVATYYDVQEAVLEAGIDSDDEKFDEIVESVMKLAEKKGRDGDTYTFEELIEEVQENEGEEADLSKDDAVDNAAELDKSA